MLNYSECVSVALVIQHEMRMHRIVLSSVALLAVPDLSALSHKRHGIRKITTYLLTYVLTPWSRVLLEKLIGSAASQEIPRIFGTRRFLTVLTSARHLSLS